MDIETKKQSAPVAETETKPEAKDAVAGLKIRSKVKAGGKTRRGGG